MPHPAFPWPFLVLFVALDGVRNAGQDLEAAAGPVGHLGQEGLNAVGQGGGGDEVVQEPGHAR